MEVLRSGSGSGGRALLLSQCIHIFLTVSWMCWTQAEPQKPKPGPEYQRLHYFVGD